MNRTAVVVHKLLGKTDGLALKEQVKLKFLSFLPFLQLGAYSLMKPESFFSFNIATFQLNVLYSPASTVLTAAAPPKDSVYGLWILHSGLYTTEFGKTISDTFFTVNCNLFFLYIPSPTQILTNLKIPRDEKKTYSLSVV